MKETGWGSGSLYGLKEDRKVVVGVTWWCKACGAPGSILSNTRKWSREGQTITDTSSPGHGDSAQPGVKSRTPHLFILAQGRNLEPGRSVRSRGDAGPVISAVPRGAGKPLPWSLLVFFSLAESCDPGEGQTGWEVAPRVRPARPHPAKGTVVT